MIVSPTSGVVGSSAPPSAVRKFIRTASSAVLRLSENDRFAVTTDDVSSFKASRISRARVQALKGSTEANQLSIGYVRAASQGLDNVLGQLSKIREIIVNNASASDSERLNLQTEIDHAIAEIDSTAQKTRFGGRSLLDGSSQIHAFQSVQADGTRVAFFTDSTANITAGEQKGIQAVRVNKIGQNPGPVRYTNDGSAILSLNVSIGLTDRAFRARLGLSTGTAGSFAVFRLTGKLGSTTVRLTSTAQTLANMVVVANHDETDKVINEQAQETGVVLVPDWAAGGTPTITTLDYNDGNFVKVELLEIDAAGGTAPSIGNVGGTDPVGTTATAFGTAAVATINGERITLGGESGLQANYVHGDTDILIDFSTNLIEQIPTVAPGGTIEGKVNIDLNQGLNVTLNPGSQSGTQQFAIQNFSSNQLGKTFERQSALIRNLGWPTFKIWRAFDGRFQNGNQVIGNDSIAHIGDGGSLDLDSGDTSGATRVLDRAVKQVLEQQAQLGVLENALQASLRESESSLSLNAQAGIDISQVDSARDVAALVESGLGIETSLSVQSQLTEITRNIFDLLKAGTGLLTE